MMRSGSEELFAHLWNSMEQLRRFFRARVWCGARGPTLNHPYHGFCAGLACETGYAQTKFVKGASARRWFTPLAEIALTRDALPTTSRHAAACLQPGETVMRRSSGVVWRVLKRFNSSQRFGVVPTPLSAKPTARGRELTDEPSLHQTCG